MYIKYNTPSSYKHSILEQIINDKHYNNLYDEMDTLLLSQRFESITEVSVMLKMSKIWLIPPTKQEIYNCVKKFIKNANEKKFSRRKYMYDMSLLMDVDPKKLNAAISPELCLELCNSIKNVSHETAYLSIDFLMLKIIDDIRVKFSDMTVKHNFIIAKNQILDKIRTFDYKKETTEKETHIICWIEKIAAYLISHEINTADYILICNKICQICKNHLFVYWRSLNSTNYILLQPDFIANNKIKHFRKDILKKINQLYCKLNMSVNEIKKYTIKLLAFKTPAKENFYCLFDLLAIMSRKSEETKKFCLSLCRYILHYDSKHNIFCYRFIRKYFIESFMEMIDKSDSNEIKDEEIKLLITLFHIDTFFRHYRHNIFKNIVSILSSINTADNKLTRNNFYRYCDVLDYILAYNSDIEFPDILDYLCEKSNNRKKIKQLFSLSLEKGFLV